MATKKLLTACLDETLFIPIARFHLTSLLHFVRFFFVLSE